MKIKYIFEKLFYLFAVGASVFLLFFVITCTWIGYEVRNNCQAAERKYSVKGCVSALTLVLDDKNAGFRERNSAIWALGQLGEKEAIPVLEKYYTGDIPDREPLDKVISQYELKKAINLARGGLNISSFFWRFDK